MIHSLLTCNTHYGESNNKVTIYTVEKYDFISNCWNELEKDEKAGWKNSIKMDHHADLVVTFLVVVTFAWSGRTSSFVIATKDIVVTKEHHS